MPFNRSSVFLEVVEGLSKSSHIYQGNDIEMAKNILYNGSQFLTLNRVNIWLLNQNGTKLKSFCSYDRGRNEYFLETDLSIESFPRYFQHIQRNDIIISVEAQNEPFNEELVDVYLKPLNICSMMEVPILSAGKLKGIICFEQTDEIREWTSAEQHFAVALTQLFTLTLETKEKNTYRQQLEQLVNEKSTLIAEINHRVKNNLAIITALIRGEMNKAKDDYHKDLFENILSKSFSLSTLQSTVYQSKNYDQVNFSDFLQTLISNMNQTYGSDKNVEVKTSFEKVYIEISKAIPCSLIVNEILTNSFKYAFQKSNTNILEVKLSKSDKKHCTIEILDNGKGLPTNYLLNGTGFELMESLTHQIDGNIDIDSTARGTKIKLEF
jgi:two-component sensor histidine kinase